MGAGPAGNGKAPAGGLADFARKLRAAWQIFFPPPVKGISPKEEGKNRLRMILVADRCAHMPHCCCCAPGVCRSCAPKKKHMKNECTTGTLVVDNYASDRSQQAVGMSTKHCRLSAFRGLDRLQTAG